MEYTTESKLSRPLLGVEREVEVAHPVDEQQEEEEQGCCDVHTTTYCDNFILWLVLPALLFVQFAIAFRLEEQQHPSTDHHDHYSIHTLEWSTVNYSIVLFVLSSYLFRRTLQETVECCNETASFWLNSTVLFLLPEIIMDILLALVLFGQVVPAFLVMVVCTMGLSLYVVLQSFQTLVYGVDKDEQVTTEGGKDYKLLQVV